MSFSRWYHALAFDIIVALLGAALFFAAIQPADSQFSDAAPLISGVQVTAANATSAVIIWRTDKKSDASVNYGLNPFYGTARDVDFEKTAHTLLLEGLLPSTTYYFRAISSDLSANQSISEGHRFTTKARTDIAEIERIKIPEQRALAETAITAIEQITDPEALTLVAAAVGRVAEEIIKAPIIIGKPNVEEGADGALFTWATDLESNSIVALAAEGEYDPSLEEPYTIEQGDADNYALEHEVQVIGLRPGTVYHYQVRSSPALGPTGQSRDATFTTKSILPDIFGIDVLRVDEDSATVIWNTSVPTRGIVEYTNMFKNITRSAGDPVFLARHEVQLTGLEFATRYQAVIVAENAGEDKVTSQPFFFTTVKDEFPPSISKVNNDSTLFPGEETKIQTIVSWATDEPAVCQFFYQESIAAGVKPDSFPPEVDFTADHVRVITNFTPSTVYKFWVECDDKTGNHARSEDFVMFTPEKEKSILDIIIENFEGTFGWVKKIGK